MNVFFRSECLRSGVVVILAYAVPAIAQSGRVEQLQKYFEEGEKALTESRYAEAQAAYEHLTKLDPGTAEVHAKLGLIYFQEGRYEDAILALRRALQLKPSLSDSNTLLAMSLSEVGRFKEALPRLEKAFHKSSSAPLQRLAGLELQRAYTSTQQDGKAVEVSMELTRIYPNDPEILYHAGKIFGNYAYRTMMKLAQAPPSSIWRHQAAGEALESQGSYERAAVEYRTVLELDPNRPGVHYRLGRVFLHQSQMPDAKPESLSNAGKEFTLELQRDPTNANASYELGEIDRKSAQLEKAREYLELAVKSDPDFEEAQLGLARTLIALSKPELALPHIRAALALAPEHALTYYHLARVQGALGNTGGQNEALEKYNRLRAQTAERESQEILAGRDVTSQEPDPQ